MKKIVVLLVLAAGLSAFAFGQDIFASFIDGEAYIQDSGEWYDLFAGDALDSGSIVKLGADTVAEIDAGGKKIVLDKPGVYKIKELLEKSVRNASWGDAAVVKKFITRTNKAASKTAVMGVRGDEAESSSVEWLTEDNMVLADAKELIEEGNYMEALSVLSENRDDAFDEELPEYDFYLGKCYYITGEPGKALAAFSRVDPDPSAEYYPDFVILEGNLFLDSFNFEQALVLFDEYLSEDSVSETAQAVTFFSAKALNAMGNKEEAGKRLKRASDMNPASEIGKEAQSILNSF